jgi:predicted DNA-binding transcriptional regulator AlpA
MSDLLNTEQAAAFVDLSVSTLEAWRKVNRGPRYLRVGRKVRYRISDLEAWVNSCAVETAA